jgi:PAS domain S-box-containing protein
MAIDASTSQLLATDRGFGSRLAAETELEAVADTVLRELADVTGADAGALYVCSDEGGPAALVSVSALDRGRLPLEIGAAGGLAGRALAEQRAITASHEPGGLRLPTLGGEVRIAHEAYVPLVHGQRSVGVIALGRVGGAAFAAGELEAIGHLAERAALGISAAVALRTARTQALLHSAVIDTAADAFLSLDEQGTVIQWNRAAELMFGWTAAETVGRPLVEQVIPERLRDEFDAFFAELVQRRESPLSGTGEVILNHADGSELTVETTVSPLRLGDRWRFNAFLRDVTARKRLELYRDAHHRVTRALWESSSLEEAREAVLNNLGPLLGFTCGATFVPSPENDRLLITGTWVAGGAAVDALVAAAPQVSVSRGEGISGRIWETGEALFVPEFLDMAAGTPKAAAEASGLRSGVAFPVFHGRRFEGAAMLFWSEERESDPDLLRMLTTLGPQIGGFVARKRAEAESERLKDEFFALVSHELRTPLTSIIGYLELVLEADGVDAQSRQFLEVVDRNAARLLRLVGDLLFVAQVEAGKLSLDPAPVDLRAVCREAIETARPTAEAHGIDLSLAADALPQTVGDAGRLGQALDALVSNAIKFTPGGGRVQLSLRASGDAAVIEVSDTGVGIPAGEQQRLFDRFFRSQTAHEQAVPGVGLGLTIVSAIVDGHGGRIGVRSEEGRGSTFTVELPLRPPPGGSPHTTPHELEVHP